MKDVDALDISTAQVFAAAAPEDVLAEIGARADAEVFIVRLDGNVLRSPAGTPITHLDRRAMAELAAELDFATELDPHQITLYGLYSSYADYVLGGRAGRDEEHHRSHILNDVVLRACAGPEVVDQLVYLEVVSDELSRNGLRHPMLAQTVTWQMDDFSDDDRGRNVLAIVDHYWDEYSSLNGFEDAAYRSAEAITDSPILASMLVKHRISPNEFAVVTLAAHCIMSKTFGDVAQSEDIELRDELVRAAEAIQRFLGRFNTAATEIEALSRRDEDTHLEFKATLRWNIDQDRKDKEIERSTLKAIAAFLNAEGGKLLIGVGDDGKLVGIDHDGFPSHDKFTLHLRGLVANHLGPEFLTLLRWRIVKWRGGFVCEVDCQPASCPAYVRHKQKTQLFVRSNNSSNQLNGDALKWYLEERFGRAKHRTNRSTRPSLRSGG